MAVTLKDLAVHVDRSITTVSRALAGYQDVSPRTRDQVLQAAEELGYEPNITARQLQKQATDTIALILPNNNNPQISDPFFSEFLAGIVDQTTRYGLDLLVTTHSPDEDAKEVYLKYIRSRRVDGFIIIRTQRNDARIKLLRDCDFPFVAFGRVETDNEFPFIDEDGELGIRMVVDHLVALGHTRLAFIAEPANLTKAHNRLQGFIKGVTAHGLPLDESLILEGGFRQRAGRLSTLQLLDHPNPPTAIVAVNDLVALGAISAAQEQGLVVGRDVSITGFDDIALAEYTHPPLTTLHLPAHEIGMKICQTLFNVINREPLAEPQVILQPELVVRQSSGPNQPSHMI
ncbi:MAG: LacI family DNA-binding transcriptional regulator [Chloroflexota bacterium]